MLTELGGRLRPQLAAGHHALMRRWTEGHLADHPTIAAAVCAYSAGDRNLNRPLLTVVGYGAHLENIGTVQLAELGELVFLPQVVRDFLAIHDDIVDGDTEKFDQPTLPAALGADTALFTADLLLGLAADLIDAAPLGEGSKNRLHRLVARILARTQHGQLTELALTRTDPATIPIDRLTRMYGDKAAAYCYVLPFQTGATAASTPHQDDTAVQHVLETIGVASQIVDDLAGNLPGGSKHTPGELLQLRRTVLLTHLATRLPDTHSLRKTLTGTHADPGQAEEIQRAFLTTGAAAASAALAHQLAAAAEKRIPDLPLGGPARAYLHDLIRVRVHGTLTRLGLHPTE